jgi:hydroxyquinol 1,2-dioxygenase
MGRDEACQWGDGPVGQLIRAQGRHNLRPAHIHFMIHKAGYKTQFSQLFAADDPHLETDVDAKMAQRLSTLWLGSCTY